MDMVQQEPALRLRYKVCGVFTIGKFDFASAECFHEFTTGLMSLDTALMRCFLVTPLTAQEFATGSAVLPYSHERCHRHRMSRV